MRRKKTLGAIKIKQCLKAVSRHPVRLESCVGENSHVFFFTEVGKLTLMHKFSTKELD